MLIFVLDVLQPTCTWQVSQEMTAWILCPKFLIWFLFVRASNSVRMIYWRSFCFLRFTYFWIECNLNFGDYIPNATFYVCFITSSLFGVILLWKIMEGIRYTVLLLTSLLFAFCAVNLHWVYISGMSYNIFHVLNINFSYRWWSLDTWCRKGIMQNIRNGWSTWTSQT